MSRKTLTQPEREDSDGSITDAEIQKIVIVTPSKHSGSFLPPRQDSRKGDIGVNSSKIKYACTDGVGGNVKLLASNHVTPCVKAENQKLASTDYANTAAVSFTPALSPPRKSHDSNFARNVENTNYLKDPEFSKLFEKCILTMYRMETWPPVENLLEEMLSAMGYQIPDRKRIIELSSIKESLNEKIQSLINDRAELLTQLDEFEDSGALHGVLDSDDILNPKPGNKAVNGELLKDIFDRLKLSPDSRDNESSDPLLDDFMMESTPMPDTLQVPINDMRINIPEAETLLEEMLNALGYEVPDKELITELSTHKQYLNQILQALKTELPDLLDRLQDFEEAFAKYGLLDQGNVSSSSPLFEGSSGGTTTGVNKELLQTSFEEIQSELTPDSRDGHSADVLSTDSMEPTFKSCRPPTSFHEEEHYKKCWKSVEGKLNQAQCF